LPCNGNSDLTIEQQKTVYEAADWLLGEWNQKKMHQSLAFGKLWELRLS
jgi:hypothetical protein